jgi:hypothetical protein
MCSFPDVKPLKQLKKEMRLFRVGGSIYLIIFCLHTFLYIEQLQI